MTGYRADTPKLKTSLGRKDITVISEAEVSGLVQRARAEDYKGLATGIRFSAYTGVRLGELMALEDVKGTLPGRLDISRQLTRKGKSKLPKGGYERTIIVPREAFARQQWANREGEAASINHSGALCRMSRTEHHRRWTRVRKICGLELDWHELRHFAATWWLRKGATPEDVAIQLGHRDGGQLVRELYGHIEEDALVRLQALAAA